MKHYQIIHKTFSETAPGHMVVSKTVIECDDCIIGTDGSVQCFKDDGNGGLMLVKAAPAGSWIDVDKVVEDSSLVV